MEEFEFINSIEKVQARLDNLKKSAKNLRRAKPSSREKVKPQLNIVEKRITELEEEIIRLKNS